MIVNPMIPIWVMAILCVCLFFVRKRGIFIILLIFIINLRIMVPGGDTPTVSTNVDILFVVDNTISMLAEDYNGDGRRIDAVKEDCKYIMEQFPGAAFSVISFGNTVKTLIPYTNDQNIVMQTLELLNGQTSIYATGTSLNDVMETMKGTLDHGRENEQIVFFISDGEITSEEELRSFSGLEKYVDAGAVLGYGTKEGGAMRAIAFVGDDDEPEYLTYYDDHFEEQKALSKIDEENLESIASDFGVDYVHMTKQSGIHDTLTAIKEQIEGMSAEMDVDITAGYVDTYYFFVIVLVLLLIGDFVHYKRKI